MHILAAGHPNWSPSVLTLSARDNIGLDALWEKITERHAALLESGALTERRADQAISWMREIFDQRLLAAFKGGRRAAHHVQGLEDKVVPPSQAEQMLEAVRAKGLPVAYVAYEGEQHGFRQSKNIKHAMESELYFYSKIFGFELADPVEPVEIENLD